MRTLARYFFQGLVFLAPIAITLYVLWVVFAAIDGWLNLPVPGLGFLITIVLVTLVGFLTNFFLAARLMRLLDRILEKLPFVKLLYTSLKDLLSAVMGDKKRFDKPVMVRVAEGASVLGFVTRDSVEDLGIPGHVAVYLPQSYNFAGQVILAPRERVTPLDVASADVMTFVVSAGIAGQKV